MLPTEKHFNGSIGLVAAALDGYNKIPNDAQRRFAHQLSKVIPVQSGRIFQAAKSFTSSTSKITSKLGPAGTLLTLGVIGYEVHEGSWNAHTFVNGGLLVATGVATFFLRPPLF